MHSIPHGYTHKDVLIAFALVIVSVASIVASMHPLRRIAEQRDELRETDVRNLMEMLVEMRYADAESFAGLVGSASNGKVMIGVGDDCSGSFGTQCNNGSLQDHCLNPYKFDSEAYLASIPVDPLHEVYSKAYTGYYLEQNDGVLTVGACSPEARDQVMLFYQL